MTVTASASRSGKPKRTTAVAAPHMADLSFLGVPPLIPGESAEDYERLLAAVTNAMKPADAMETIWTRDIVDLQWDIIRFRRIKADLITDRCEGAAWGTILESTRTENLNGKIARFVAININAVERIDRMVMTMEARRNAAYREAERHRIGLGERLHRAAEQVEDAEFREVDEATGEQKRVA
jgi:hypothetical protein